MLKNGLKTAFAQIGDFKIPSMKSETEVKPQVVAPPASWTASGEGKTGIEKAILTNIFQNYFSFIKEIPLTEEPEPEPELYFRSLYIG